MGLQLAVWSKTPGAALQDKTQCDMACCLSMLTNLTDIPGVSASRKPLCTCLLLSLSSHAQLCMFMTLHHALHSLVSAAMGGAS